MSRSVPPKGLEIRVADKSDLDALVTAMGQPDFFTDRIGRTRQGAGELLVAWLDGEVVGDVYLYREVHEEPELRREFPGVPLLNHLEVTPAWQGRGIGTALVHACEAAARERGHDVLILGVGLDNSDAKRLYKRLGYVDWGRGPIVTRWTEPDGAGGVRYASLDMDVMVRSMAASANRCLGAVGSARDRRPAGPRRPAVARGRRLGARTVARRSRPRTAP